jgi:hypothetical protein
MRFHWGLLCLLFLGGVKAHAHTYNFAASNERIFQLTLGNGYLLADALLAFEEESGLYLPFDELASALGFAVIAHPNQGRVEAVLRTEDERLVLDLKACDLRMGSSHIQGKKFKETCSFGQVFEDEFYISKTLVSRWLQIEIEIQSLRARMLVRSERQLPVERVLEEEESRKFRLARNFHNKKGERGVLSDAKKNEIGGPYFDVNLYSQSTFGPDDKGFHQRGVNGTASFEYKNFENSLLYSLTPEQNIRTQYTLSRHRTEGEYLGPLRYTQLRAFDVHLPQVSGITNSRRGHGVVISNQPLEYSGDFSSTSIRGVTEANWIVELYQAGILVAAQNSDEFGNYEFEAVSIFHGKNIFKIVSIGPQGQRRETYRTYAVDSSHPGKDNVYYSLSAAKTDTGNEVAFISDLGLTSRLSWNSRLLGNCHIDESCRWYWGSGLKAHFELVSSSIDYILGPEQQSYIKPQLSFLFANSALDLSYAYFDELETPVYPKFGDAFLEHQAQVLLSKSIHWGFLPFVLRGENVFSVYQDLEQPLVESKLAILMTIRGWHLQLALERRDGLMSSWVFREQLEYVVGADRWKLQFLQTSRETNSAFMEYSRRTSDGRWSWSLSANHEFSTDRLIGRYSVARKFHNLWVGSELSSDFQNEITLMLNMSTALSLDSHKSQIHQSSRGIGHGSMLVIHVCEDDNFNGVCEADERPVEGVILYLNNRSRKLVSNSRGQIYIDHLSAFSNYEVNVDVGSVSHLDLQSTKDNFYIYSEPLRTYRLDVPLHRIIEFDGVIEYENDNEASSLPVKNRNIILRSLQTGQDYLGRTEFDGYFLIEGLRPEEYQVIVELREGEELSPQLEMINFGDEDTPQMLSIDFKIKKGEVPLRTSP